MTLHYEYLTRVVFEPSITRHNILLRCLPADVPFMKLTDSSFRLSEGFWQRESTDSFGNRIITGGTGEHHSTLEYSSRGIAEMSTYCIPDASPNPVYRFPTPLTTLPPQAIYHYDDFLENCIGIMHYVHDMLTYTPGTTDMNTSVCELLVNRRGVCQDYAHLMVALCRQAGYHARYVCGLMLGEGATHAWVEVHDGRCWYAFDPTNDTAIATGYIKLAHGRDAKDCAVNRGVYIGNALQSTIVSVSVTEAG